MALEKRVRGLNCVEPHLSVHAFFLTLKSIKPVNPLQIKFLIFFLLFWLELAIQILIMHMVKAMPNNSSQCIYPYTYVTSTYMSKSSELFEKTVISEPKS